MGEDAVANIKLGWDNPSGSVLTGPDATNLRRIFDSLTLWLSYPLIGLSNNALVIAPTVGTTLAWTTEIYDEFQLHDANATTFRAPSEFRSWLGVGATAIQYAGSGGTYRSLAWKLNGNFTSWQVDQVPLTGTTALACPFIQIVSRGDTLSVFTNQDAGGNQDADAEAWMVFLPMG